ncbi:MAG: type II secretion system minor pseudopilin GspI [Woeseiaceae bacterium]|nr:type II secretion system minor pseudopilin GspI [Woeseiaceae bacterium]
MMTSAVAKCPRLRGFTLIEVMVALAILAVTLTGAAVAMGGMLNNATTLRERTYASWIAQNKIIEYRLSNEIPDVGEESGEVEYASVIWEWRAEVAETGVDNLLRIDVTISRPETDVVIRSVTGFVGEPVAPGQSNQAWSSRGRGGDDDEEENPEVRR